MRTLAATIVALTLTATPAGAQSKPEPATVEFFGEQVPATLDLYDLGRLAMCESGGRPYIQGRLYGGMYQFLTSTWHSIGGSTDLPSQASVAEQTEMTRRLLTRSGWGQWPGCSRKLGYR